MRSSPNHERSRARSTAHVKRLPGRAIARSSSRRNRCPSIWRTRSQGIAIRCSSATTTTRSRSSDTETRLAAGSSLNDRRARPLRWPVCWRFMRARSARARSGHSSSGVFSPPRSASSTRYARTPSPMVHAACSPRVSRWSSPTADVRVRSYTPSTPSRLPSGESRARTRNTSEGSPCWWARTRARGLCRREPMAPSGKSIQRTSWAAASMCIAASSRVSAVERWLGGRRVSGPRGAASHAASATSGSGRSRPRSTRMAVERARDASEMAVPMEGTLAGPKEDLPT